jgi:phosphate acetyltransferase
VPKSIFLTATQRGSGKSSVALGLISLLERTIGNVGYFKPIGQKSADYVDPDVLLMKQAFGLKASLEDIQPFTMDDVAESLATDKHDQLMERVLDSYSRIQATSDFVVCEGTDYFGAMAAFESNVNAEISKNLGAPILLVANSTDAETGEDRPIGEVVDDVCMVKDSFDELGCEFFGVVVNKCPADRQGEYQSQLQDELSRHGVRLLGVIPRAELLEKVRLEEVAAQLGAKIISGENRLNMVVQKVLVAAMGLENVLARLEKGALIVTPGDRDDLLVGIAAAYVSPTIPTPAGVVLTGGLEPSEHVKNLIIDLTGGQMPIMKVQSNTYETAIDISDVKPRLESHQRMRIEVAKGLVERYVNDESLLTAASVDTGLRRVTPRQFLHQIMARARQDKRHIVLPEGTDDRMIQATAILLERDVVNLTLLGPEAEIRKRLEQVSPRADQVNVIDPAGSEWREPFARKYIELRTPKKNPTWDLSYDLMADVSYFGTMMVHEGQADGMVSGAAHTTAHTLRPALEFIKVREGVTIASSVFFMCLPDMVLVYGDCAVNPNPTAEGLADIALASAETARAFGIDPYVAMLSYSTGESGTGSDVDKVREATRLVKERNPSLLVEGPIQYDAAVDPDVGRAKLPGSRVAGAATVFIFPDLNSGNNTYKAVQRSARAIAVGPVMQGLRRPVNDLSRGCTVRDIVNTVAITAVQAQRS